MKRWAMLGLMLLLLCGCGKQTISLPEAQQPDREPKPSASEGSGETAQVQKENTENDTDPVFFRNLYAKTGRCPDRVCVKAQCQFVDFAFHRTKHGDCRHDKTTFLL